jgi:AcrR family transcriptional regulator
MRRGIHKGLTPANILEEAFAMVDGGGPAALTMRGLASRLDVAAMAIYNHYADRDAILDALAERVFAEIQIESLAGTTHPRGRQNWRQRLRSMVSKAQQLAARHPHIYRLSMTRPSKPASAFELAAEAMGALREAGLSESQAVTVYQTFLMLLHGFPFWREGFEQHLSEPAPCVGHPARNRSRSPELMAEQQFAASVEWLLDAIDGFSPDAHKKSSTRKVASRKG